MSTVRSCCNRASSTLGKKKATSACLPIRLSKDKFLPSDPGTELLREETL